MAFREPVVSAAAAMYQERVPIATGTLINLLVKAGLSSNVFWQGTSKCLLHETSALSCSRRSGLYSAFVWLNGNSVSCYKINCSFLVALSERLHSWYCARLDQPKID